MTNTQHREIGQHDGQHHNTHPVYHFQRLIGCVPIYWLPTFSLNARYANSASRRPEIEGWIASLQRVRAWLNAAGRTEQRLMCVGTGGAIPKRWAR